MQQELQEFETLPPQRPMFLKVLCILTFIGSGYAIISSAAAYVNADKIAVEMVNAQAKMNDKIQNKKTSDPGGNAFATKLVNNMAVMANPVNLRKSSIGNIIASVICLLGALLMWRLRKPGFYLYVLGTIIGIAVPFYVFGGNSFTALSVGFSGFIGILFVIFYAMNLKSMK